MRVVGSTEAWRNILNDRGEAMHPNLKREMEVCDDMLQFFHNCERCGADITKLFKAKGLTWAKRGDASAK